MDELIKSVQEEFLKEELPDVETGDKIRVYEKLEEGSKGRTQIFEGILLRRSGSGTEEMITVRKISSGIGVEKTFPLHSPKIEKVELVKKGDVRQARPFFLRSRRRY